MAGVNETQRTYHSPSREEAARRTREFVVQTAAEVFVAQGYVGATIEQIAARASVSRPTVFAVGNKAQLFALAWRHAVIDSHVSAEDEDYRKILTITDPHYLLEQFATMTAASLRRLGPLPRVLEQAAGTDPELAELLESTQEKLLEIAAGVVAAIAATGSLRRGISLDAATDVLWLQIQPTNYRRLVEERGWSHDEFDRWHAAAMVTTLLEPTDSQSAT